MEDISLSLSEDGTEGWGLYCRSQSYNWCSRLDDGLSSADYDNNAFGVNFWYRHAYPKCLAATDLKTDQMIKVEKNETLDIFECAAQCKFEWSHMYVLMKVSRQ